MIEYAGELTGVEPQHLDGFFVGWPSPPSPERHLEVLRRSSHVVVARDGERVVGFVTAISDGVLSAFIPLLEVLPEYQGRGIGTELVRRLLARLDGLYMVDLWLRRGRRRLLRAPRPRALGRGHGRPQPPRPVTTV